MVEYPEGVGYANPPKLWREEQAEMPYNGDPDAYDEFRWPQARRYLSYSGARKRADLLRRYGCVVGIQRSEPIIWVEP